MLFLSFGAKDLPEQTMAYISLDTEGKISVKSEST